MDANERKSPGTRTGRFEDREQGLLEDPDSHIMNGGDVRTAQDGAQRQECPAMAVIRSGLFQPVALVIHKVAKAPGFRIESVPREREITGCQVRRLYVAQFFEECADH